MNRAAKPLLAAAKINAAKNDRTGALKRSLIKKVVAENKKRGAWAGVGADSSYKTMLSVSMKNGKIKKKYAKPSKYSHLVEHGTVRSAAKPFLRTALNSTRAQIESIIAAGASEALNVETKRAPKISITKK